MSLWGFLFTAQKFIQFFPSDKKILENNVSIKKKKGKPDSEKSYFLFVNPP